MTEEEIIKYWDKLKNETYAALGHKPLPVFDSTNMTLENITKESEYKLNEIALFEFNSHFAKAVKYKDFNFIIVPINDKYQYTTEQYLALLENYHNHIEKLSEGLKEFKEGILYNSYKLDYMTLKEAIDEMIEAPYETDIWFKNRAKLALNRVELNHSQD